MSFIPINMSQLIVILITRIRRNPVALFLFLFFHFLSYVCMGATDMRGSRKFC